MGKWAKELERALKISRDQIAHRDKVNAAFETYIKAANSMTEAFAKAAPELVKLTDSVNVCVEEFAKAVTELSVYEDDLAVAKKDKDKAKVKELEKKMKGLVKEVERAKTEQHSFVKKYISLANSTLDTALALGKATATASTLKW